MDFVCPPGISKVSDAGHEMQDARFTMPDTICEVQDAKREARARGARFR